MTALTGHDIVVTVLVLIAVIFALLLAAWVIFK